MIQTLLAQADGLWRAGRLAEAAAVAAQAVRSAPQSADAHHLAALILASAGRFAESLPLAERGAALAPADADAWSRAAAIAHNAGAMERAVELSRRAMQVRPNVRGAPDTLIKALARLGRFRDAAQEAERAVAADPTNPVLPALAYMVLTRAGRVDLVFDLLRRGAAAHPNDLEVQAMNAFAYNYAPGASGEATLAAHVAYGQVAARAVAGVLPPPRAPSDPDRKLRVGLYSGDFRRHSVAYFARALFEHLDRRQFCVVALSAVERHDDLTALLRAQSDEWHDLGDASPADLARAVRARDIDILIDLVGLTDYQQFAAFAARPAPVQLTYCGYTNTTGLPGIDWRVVDRWTDPPEAHAWHSERLLRLDRCFLCYTPPPDAPPVAAPPHERNGHVTFGSFNALLKIHEGVINLWTRTVNAVPAARLVLKNAGLIDAAVRAELAQRFERAGLERGRLDLEPLVPSTAGHLELYSRVDIGLDTFPFGGATTTCEALHMGVPVVSLAQRSHVSRVGRSLLTAVGLGELAVDTEAAFVSTAAALAGDRHRLSALRLGLRDRLARSPLGDGADHAQHFGRALRQIWHTACS